MIVVSFLLLVGVLVFVHELGHYVWARAFGVRVLRFSIGFGPTILSFTRGSTEYRLGIIPLGGYVRMLGESADDVVPPGQEWRSLEGQPIWRRLVVVLAGPAMNLAFPILLFFLVGLGETQLLPPVVGAVLSGHPATGKLEPGDKILRVDDEEVASFEEIKGILSERAGESVRLGVERGQETLEVVVVPTSVARPSLSGERPVGAIGILPIAESPVVGVTSERAPAALAGLRTFDQITALGGVPIRRFHELAKVLDRNRGAMIPVTYLRGESQATVGGGAVRFSVFAPHVATLSPAPGVGAGLERAGIESAELYVDAPEPRSIEDLLHLREGDRIVAIDDVELSSYAHFHQLVLQHAGREVGLTWRSGAETRTTRLRLPNADTHDELVSEPYLRHWVAPQPIANPNRVGSALKSAFARTFELAHATIASVFELFGGSRGFDEVGGPFAVFELVRVAASEGTLHYLSLMAFLSMQVGLVNLLPIPLLDGGHVLYLVAESMLRRPIPTRVREISGWIGVGLLGLLIVLAVTNDLLRHGPLWWSMVRGR